MNPVPSTLSDEQGEGRSSALSGKNGRQRAGLERAQPLVSCVIIFLNEEKYLTEAIESVLGQSYGKWELLLVDDGSTDRSVDIARAYSARQPDRIRLLAHENGANCGMSASRNLGLKGARGSLVAFLDGDDTWYSDKLEHQVDLFRQHPEAVMVSGATLFWHSWEAHHDRPDRIVRVGQGKRGDRSAADLKQDHLYAAGTLNKQLYPLGSGQTPSSSGIMVKRDSALAVGGFEDSFRGLFEDQVFLAKMSLAGPSYVSKTVFDRYRQHRESCYSSTLAPEKELLRRRYLTWFASYLDRINCRDRVIRAKLRLAILRLDHPTLYRLVASAVRSFERVLNHVRPGGRPLR